MVVCTGYTESGLPLNAQIVGRHFDEPTVLRVAQAYEGQADALLDEIAELVDRQSWPSD